MKTKDAIEYFGSATAVASAAGISRAAVSQWGEVVPLGTAALLERAACGKLELRPSDYRRTPPVLPFMSEDRAA